MADELEGRQIQGAALESFRCPATRIIRVRGGDFWVVVQECGNVAIHYPDRIVRVAPRVDVVLEPKPVHDKDAQSPRSDPDARKRGSR